MTEIESREQHEQLEKPRIKPAGKRKTGRSYRRMMRIRKNDDLIALQITEAMLRTADILIGALMARRYITQENISNTPKTATASGG